MAMEEMDRAAVAATGELDRMSEDPETAPGVQAVRDWMKANYMGAGYKRLSQLLVGNAKLKVA